MSDSTVDWCLESYDSGVARLFFPSDGKAAEATWTITDTVYVVRGLSQAAAVALVDEINVKPDTQLHQEHAVAERMGDSGFYSVRKTVHNVHYNGTKKSDEDS